MGAHHAAFHQNEQGETAPHVQYIQTTDTRGETK